jgi:hypothetical protein
MEQSIAASASQHALRSEPLLDAQGPPGKASSGGFDRPDAIRDLDLKTCPLRNAAKPNCALERQERHGRRSARQDQTRPNQQAPLFRI